MSEEYVVISLGDLLDTRRINTEVTPEDSNDVAAGFCSCGPNEGCTDCPPGAFEEAYMCGNPACDICGDSDEGLLDFICDTLDEIDEEESEFDDPIEAAVVVGVSTLVDIADDLDLDPGFRLDAAELLLGFWADATFGR